MKHLYKYLLIGLLSITFTPIETFAQSIDANRMNRDISIMENILSELFRAQQLRGEDSRIVVAGTASGISYFSNNSVKGTYLPGFGIIFNISGPTRNIYVTSSGTRSTSYSFYYDDDDGGDNNSSEITEASVVNRVTDFLRDYGTTIGQLRNDEQIMVIYGSQNRSSRELFYALSTVRGQNNSNTEQEKPDRLPVISVSATVKNLNDYRSGKINASAFEDRLKVATSEEREYLDLKVMGNIFKTALSNQPKNSFRLHGAGDINYLFLDNFGAIFSLNVRYTEENVRWGNSFAREFARVQSSFDADKEKEEYQEYLKKVSAAFDDLKVNLKEYIIDYGRTISSVSDDQYILLSVIVNGRMDEIPERMDIQVKKSVFNELDRGRITRDQALGEVVVTEY